MNKTQASLANFHQNEWSGILSFECSSLRHENEKEAEVNPVLAVYCRDPDEPHRKRYQLALGQTEHLLETRKPKFGTDVPIILPSNCADLYLRFVVFSYPGGATLSLNDIMGSVKCKASQIFLAPNGLRLPLKNGAGYVHVKSSWKLVYN